MLRWCLAIPMFLIAAVLLGGAARAEMGQVGTLRLSFDADFAPHSLPRERPVPVTVSVDGSIATTDGSHPPALRHLEIALNRNGRLSTRGLALCPSPALQSTTSETALERCAPAQVGRGSFRADLDSEQAAIPVRGRILVFNSRHRGKPALLLHLYGTVPVQATFVLPLAISRRSEGQFGTVLATKVPALAGGLGSITDIELKIGRTYRYQGQPRSFISASCAAPAGFSSALFPFARGSFRFAGGQGLDIPLIRTCRVR